jgi:signal transduction histidine kinase
VVRILEGEPLTSVAPIIAEPNPAMFDWRELRAYGVDDRMLPAGSIVRFREPTVWESYGWYILTTVGVIVIQALFIAGLVASRRRRHRAQRALAEQLRFERLIVDLSAHLVDVPPDKLEGEIERGLERVRELLGVDRASVIRFIDGPIASRVAHATARGARALAPTLDNVANGDALAALREGRIIAASRVEELPAALATARATFEELGLRSVFAVPLQGDGEVLGALTLGTTHEPYQWDEELEPRFRLLADLFASAIARKQSADELERSEALGDAVLASLAAQVAVLERDGTIVLVNTAWEAGGHDPASPLARLAPGESYLEACRAAARRGEETGRHALAGLESVLAGTASTFTMEYVEAAGEGEGEVWYQMTVETMKRPEGGAVVSLRNITARKRAELKAEHRRQELAHVARVSTMGELAASLAHELNQPLSGVLTNAQTALRFLAVDPPNLDEVREILNDIVEDDRRAGEVIRRLKSMLQTGKTEAVAVNINLAVAEVQRLLASDSILRNTSIELSLAPDLPPVLGDRIQLQQVLLNLVVNAMDAMRGVVAEERRVTIRTELVDAATAQVTVADRGTGIAEEKLGQVFQPFFSTKSEGMGIGLSIARTIVEAHGGTLAAANNPDRGATFILTLPINRMEHYAVR